MRKYVRLHELLLLGYCLMSNHVHLLIVPREADALAQGLKHTHGQYASYWNATHASSGHVWQGRFYSCPLDNHHLWMALRYVELNPVRAGLVRQADLWPWSSAAAHLESAIPDSCLELETWSKRWSSESWRQYLATPQSEAELAAIRRSTHTGRPLGSSEFIHALEEVTLRRLTPQKGGRPSTTGSRQEALNFEK